MWPTSAHAVAQEYQRTAVTVGRAGCAAVVPGAGHDGELAVDDGGQAVDHRRAARREARQHDRRRGAVDQGRAGPVRARDAADDRLHRVGLSVFAAVDLVRAPWLENRTDWQTSVFNPREHAVRPWGYLDVLNPSVNTHFAALLSDLAQTQLDGVLFRTRTRNSFAYEVSEIALSGFQSQYHETAADVTRALENSAASVQNEPPPAQPGETPAQEPPAGTLWHWVGWRARQELDALAQLRRTLQQTRHGLRVILEMHSEAASDPLSTLVNYGEDVAEASRRGFDILLNGTARAADLQQVADLVKQAEVKALRKPVKGQPSGQQVWILNRGQGFGGRDGTGTARAICGSCSNS